MTKPEAENEEHAIHTHTSHANMKPEEQNSPEAPLK